jgi:mannitol-specific phosphotransferase system IIBC component
VRYPGKSKENDMIGKIIGAVAGSKVAKHTSGVSGPFGAAAGIVTASALRRMSIPAMVALAAGGYFAKKAMDRRQNGRVRPAA